jgi:hypothetical protein
MRMFMIVGGALFGSATVVAVGTFMGRSSGDISNPALAGGIAGIGLALLLIGLVSRRD